MGTPYNIGDQLWRATWTPSETHVICPDCCGHGRLRVIMGDETEVSIECANCKRGYNPPTGRIVVYDRAPRAEVVTVTGVQVEADGVKYNTSGSWGVPEAELFYREADALARAAEIAAEADAAERDRVNHKAKDSRSWAWNATYHRKCIRDAEREIERHKAKLAVASLKAREERSAKSKACA